MEKYELWKDFETGLQLLFSFFIIKHKETLGTFIRLSFFLKIIEFF